MTSANAQTKMKALVVSRLLLGDFNDWEAFRRERDVAGKIANRRVARSVTSQIGRNYRTLSGQMRQFIERNFARCDYDDLSRLCDAIEIGAGLNLRLDEFEKFFFPINESVKIRTPFYAHVCISTHGLQFEFPEHHFMNDIQAGFSDLKETQRRLEDLGITDNNMKSRRDEIAQLVGREKFVSRSVVSAAFSLVEAFISGLFYTALHTKQLGKLVCDETFLQYVKNKETAALRGRIDQVVRFASEGAADGSLNPFKPFIEIGKLFRDAIHHTTPFERKDLEAGQRLEALYNIKLDVAVLCSLLSLQTVLRISEWLYGKDGGGDIAQTCKSLHDDILAYSVEKGIAKVSEQSV